MPFSRADPRVIEAIDVISTLDQQPNLLDLTPKESTALRVFTCRNALCSGMMSKVGRNHSTASSDDSGTYPVCRSVGNPFG
jgi:hypothetical protein